MAIKRGRKVVGDLREAASSDSDTDVRKSAVFALSRLPGDEAATQLIIVANSNRDCEVRKQAIF
jgi:HEAT repeat protein